MDNIKAIRTEDDYDWALAEIESYFDMPPEPGTSEAERFDVLAALIEAYEAKHWQIEAADPVDTIKTVMENEGYEAKDLAVVLGSRSRASEILNRVRPLNLAMIQKLNKEWRIPASLLIAPYHLES
jgi:HTH-type transcriptional regulator / antitoxin HigA